MIERLPTRQAGTLETPHRQRLNLTSRNLSQNRNRGDCSLEYRFRVRIWGGNAFSFDEVVQRTKTPGRFPRPHSLHRRLAYQPVALCIPGKNVLSTFGTPQSKLVTAPNGAV